MPILSFDIRNQGPIVHVACDNVPKLMIIVGPNGVGKSTLLELLYKAPPNMVKVTQNNRRIYIGPHRVSIPYSLRKRHLLLGPQIKRNVFGATALPSLPELHVPTTTRSRKTPDYLHLYVKYSIAQFKADEAFLCRDILYAKGSLKIEEVRHIFEPFKKFIKFVLPNLEFVDVRFEGEFVKVIFRNSQGKEIEFDDLSSGEKDSVSLAWILIEKQIENEIAKLKGQQPLHEDLTVIIDGLEQWLHPELQRRFLDYFRTLIEEAERGNESLQFIIATHSPTIVNYASAKELYIMLYPHQIANNDNQLRRITSDDEKLSIIRDVLGDLSFLTYGKPIVIVESSEDKDILSILTDGKIEELAIIRPLGGKGKIVAFIEGLKNVIPDLISMGIKILAVLDKDRGDVIKYAQEDKYGIFFIWPVACIENLLLDSEVIYETLKVLKPDKVKQKITDLGDLEKLLQEEVSKLVPYEVLRRIGEIIYFKCDLKNYLNKYKDMMPSANELKRLIYEDCVKKTVERRIGLYDEISRKVSEEVASGDWKVTICAKELLRRLAGIFGISYDTFIKVLADKYKTIKGVPFEVQQLIKKLTDA